MFHGRLKDCASPNCHLFANFLHPHPVSESVGSLRCPENLDCSHRRRTLHLLFVAVMVYGQTTFVSQNRKFFRLKSAFLAVNYALDNYPLNLHLAPPSQLRVFVCETSLSFWLLMVMDCAVQQVRFLVIYTSHQACSFPSPPLLQTKHSIKIASMTYKFSGFMILKDC